MKIRRSDCGHDQRLDNGRLYGEADGFDVAFVLSKSAASKQIIMWQ